MMFSSANSINWGRLLPQIVYYISAYCDMVLQAPDLVTVTAIAKDYGYAAVTFNQILHELRIQFKVGKLWVLYQEHADKGYTQTKTFINDGNAHQHTYWTQAGRLFLYHKLKENNFLPTIELKNCSKDIDTSSVL